MKKGRKDFLKKRNVKRNNIPRINSKYVSLKAGDGTLPKSRKFKEPKLKS